MNKRVNKRCDRCGSLYGVACQNCCEHETLYLFDDYEEGIEIRCIDCDKDFTVEQFELGGYKIVRKDD